ncbi:alpha-1,2-fucosyltransferase [Patescibacteria group bacterium]|nr:alpha-1,2-fucosyltransferase [Patescibacteria group bacterium]
MSIVRAKSYGRCGNALFQLGCAIAYSLKHNIEFSVPTYTENPFWNPLYFPELANPQWVEGREDIILTENGHQYQELEFREEWRGLQIVLDGYWQSWKYIEPYRDEILYLFGLPYKKKEGHVSVHIRRGDYLELKMKHPEVTKEWYEEQMAKFPNYKFKFFSDDIKYCKETFGHREDCEFSDNTSELADLVEAATCEHNICSASTFSFWIAWLNRNENKVCIFPKLWFVEGWCNLITTDILHPNWLKV